MKLVVQIPCLNEASTLETTLAGIPRAIPGIGSIEIIVIDDGSQDDTREVAQRAGVAEVIRHTRNLGLAFAFRSGLDACLRRGADIIVNMDGDNQYRGEDIPRLIAPILAAHADMVVGDRQTDRISHFSGSKKFLQRLGTFIVTKLSSINVADAPSGFRAFSRAAALKLTILSNYSYTLESLLQVQSKGLTVVSVPISVNPPTRPSRLFQNIRQYLIFSVATILRVFTMYNPLRIFIYTGGILLLMGLGLTGRFVFFYFWDGGQGKIQSLIIAAIFCTSGVAVLLAGFVADLIQFNRRLLEDILERVKKLEFGDRR